MTPSASTALCSARRRLQGLRRASGCHVDDVISGQCYPKWGGSTIGRVPVSTRASQCRCLKSNLTDDAGPRGQAVIDAAVRIQTGVAELVVAGGSP